MRYRAVRFLHMRGIHALCHRSIRYVEWPSIRLDDGTSWTPDISGINPFRREVHTP